MATLGQAFSKVPRHPRNQFVPPDSPLASNWVGKFCLGQYLDNVFPGVRWLPADQKKVPTVPLALHILILIVQFQRPYHGPPFSWPYDVARLLPVAILFSAHPGHGTTPRPVQTTHICGAVSYPVRDCPPGVDSFLHLGPAVLGALRAI